jgi:hypothetical protein
MTEYARLKELPPPDGRYTLQLKIGDIGEVIERHADLLMLDFGNVGRIFVHKDTVELVTIGWPATRTAPTCYVWPRDMPDDPCDDWSIAIKENRL